MIRGSRVFGVLHFPSRISGSSAANSAGMLLVTVFVPLLGPLRRPSKSTLYSLRSKLSLVFRLFDICVSS